MCRFEWESQASVEVHLSSRLPFSWSLWVSISVSRSYSVPVCLSLCMSLVSWHLLCLSPSQPRCAHRFHCLRSRVVTVTVRSSRHLFSLQGLPCACGHIHTSPDRSRACVTSSQPLLFLCPGGEINPFSPSGEQYKMSGETESCCLFINILQTFPYFAPLL